MENQIKKNLKSLRKISNFKQTTRIDTTEDDVDEFMDGIYNTAYRMAWDSRKKARQVLYTKFNDCNELTKLIIESGQFIAMLPIIRAALEKTKTGLALYKSNPRYLKDAKMQNDIGFLIDTEVPARIGVIDDYLAKNKIMVNSTEFNVESEL